LEQEINVTLQPQVSTDDEDCATPDVWSFSPDATVAAGLLVAFWLGVLFGFLGAKGALL